MPHQRSACLPPHAAQSERSEREAAISASLEGLLPHLPPTGTAAQHGTPGTQQCGSCTTSSNHPPCRLTSAPIFTTAPSAHGQQCATSINPAHAIAPPVHPSPSAPPSPIMQRQPMRHQRLHINHISSALIYIYRGCSIFLSCAPSMPFHHFATASTLLPSSKAHSKTSSCKALCLLFLWCHVP